MTNLKKNKITAGVDEVGRGCLAGPVVSAAVILKKGNKEYVVAKGDKLDGLFELIEVNNEEIVFRNQEKLYKIENLVGNNL